MSRLLKAAMALAEAREPFNYDNRWKTLRCRYCDIKSPNHEPECVYLEYANAKAEAGRP